MASGPCVGSGMCCKRAPCGYGRWNETKTQCAELQEDYRSDLVTIYKCGLFEHISKQPGAEYMPAFNTACCQSLFNEAREQIINVVRTGSDAGALETLRRRLNATTTD